MSDEIIDLRGAWRFRENLDDGGCVQEWDDESFDTCVELPGTTEENEIGERTEDWTTEHLARPYRYEGSAWYQREVQIPDGWTDKRIVLSIERSRATCLWVDGKKVGQRESLTTEQEYDLTDVLSPGAHVLTIRVDNTGGPFEIEGVKKSHMATDHTQTNWNGILGKIELRKTDLVWIEEVRVSSDMDRKIATVEVTLGSRAAVDVDGTLTLDAESRNADEPHWPSAEMTSITIPTDGTTVEIPYQMGEEALSWDEFTPAFYELSVDFEGSHGEEVVADSTETTFGLREFDVDGTQFAINDATVFLRGTTDCCVFPETGYAPMSVDAWRDVFSTAKQYGLNHYRFHSWCPPEAAFRAADELGIYLQPELPQWDYGNALVEDRAYDYYRRETERILDTYGNHPSFVMFALGNELAGDQERMAEIVDFCREHDGRHCYAQGSNNFFGDTQIAENDDFWVTTATEWDPATLANFDTDDPVDPGLIRGSTGQHTIGHVNNTPPSTDANYSNVVDHVSMPLVSHEVGQYQVYPDFDRIGSIKGVLEANNLETFRQHLAIHEMEERASEFQQASGRLAVECYREEVEAALRTPGFGGFQLLQLQDFPGQGTALVGLLDMHMNSKGLILPEQWREFCGPVVPLLQLDQLVFTADEELNGEVKIANYGPENLTDITVSWELVSENGAMLATGNLTSKSIAQGSVGTVGSLATNLDAASAPTKATLTVSLDQTERNNYDVWIFPEQQASPETGPVVRRAFDKETRARLRRGEDVLLIPSHSDLPYSIEGTFQPDFWNYSHFNGHGNPGTFGLCCQPDHPALAEFPTEFHADWQWWRLLSNARPVVLDDTAESHRPIAEMIDTFVRNHKLGVIFEATVGNGGNLLVCTIDLLNERSPEGMQLFESLLSYVTSDSFNPDETIHEPLLHKLLTDPAENNSP